MPEHKRPLNRKKFQPSDNLSTPWVTSGGRSSTVTFHKWGRYRSCSIVVVWRTLFRLSVNARICASIYIRCPNEFKAYLRSRSAKVGCIIQTMAVCFSKSSISASGWTGPFTQNMSSRLLLATARLAQNYHSCRPAISVAGNELLFPALSELRTLMCAALLAELSTIKWSTVRHCSALLPCVYSCYGVFHGIVVYFIFNVFFYKKLIGLYIWVGIIALSVSGFWTGNM